MSALSTIAGCLMIAISLIMTMLGAFSVAVPGLVIATAFFVIAEHA